MDDKYYPQTIGVFRDRYRSRRWYIEAYRDCCKHYGYKVRVEGGWRFFEHSNDLRTWQRQR